MGEIFDEQGDIGPTFAQGGHVQWEHVEPIEEVRAEGAVGDGSVQISIRSGNHADVHADRPAATDPLEFVLLQHAQQHDLGLGGEFADLVEEDGSAVGQLEATLASLQGSGERPFSWPNSSEAMNDDGIAAQFTATKARAERGDRLWIARAMSSLPVPVSPVISTVESVGATLDTCDRTVRSGGEVPTISSNMEVLPISSRSPTVNVVPPLSTIRRVGSRWS